MTRTNYVCGYKYKTGLFLVLASLLISIQAEEIGAEELPGPPQDLKSSIVKARFVALSWQPPVFTNGVISAYSVYYRQEGSERERVQNTSRSHLEDIIIGGLEPGQVYYFRVVAQNLHGTGPSSKSLRVVTQSEEHVPSAPLELNVFSTSSRSIHVSWKPPENSNGEIQRYNVYFMETSSSTEHHLETTNLECDLLSLSVFTEYYIWVVAINHNGPGIATEQKVMRTFSASPSQPPYNVTLEPASSTSIIARWKPPPPEGQNGVITGYKLKYRKQGRKGDTITTPGNLRIFSLNNLERGSLYQVKLLATNVNGTGPSTKWHEVETYENDLDETKVPERPSRLKVRPSSDKIYVMWSPPQNQSIKIRNYVIGWGKGVPNYTEVLDEIQRSFDIHGVEPNSEYVISLYAHNDVGAGEPVYSYVRTREELPPEPISPLIPPMGLKAHVTGSTSVVLYWTDNTLGKPQDVRDHRYYIVKCTDEKSRSRSLNVTRLYAEFSDLNPNTIYEFMVKLVRGRRESPWSRVVQNTTWATAPNTAPKDLHVVPVKDNANVAELRWLPPKMQNSYIIGYIILYTTNESITDREWTPQGVKGDKHSYIIHNLEPSTTYFFKIQARNSKGNGPFSQVVSFQTGATEESGAERLPGPPQDLKASIVKARFVTLSWQPPVLTNGLISAYSVYYRQEGSEREQVQNTSHSNLEDINIGGLQPGQVYFFKVVAHNTHGTGPSSKSLRIITQSEELVPSAPLELNAFSTSSSSIYVSWKLPENPNGEIQRYNVYYTEMSSPTEHHLETTNLEFDLLSLSAFTEYYIWVNAVNHNGPGTTSEKKLVKTFSAAPSQPPYNVTLEPTSSTSIIVRWDSPPPEGQNGIITGYKLKYRKQGRKGNTLTTPGNLRIFPLNNLERGSVYQVKLLATNVNGTGPPTKWHEVETYDNDLDETKIPEQPSRLKVRPSSEKIYVMWSPPQNQSIKIRNYVIGWGKGVPDNYTEVLDEIQRSFIIHSVEPNSEYVISLYAHNDVGAGEPVYSYVRTRDELPPEPISPLIPPMGLKANVTGSTSVVLYWTDSTLGKTEDVRDNRYYIVKCTDEKSRSRSLNVTQLYAEFFDLKPNTLYEFMVKLVNRKRESPWSLAVQNTTWGVAQYAAPKDLHVVAVEDNPNDVELRWLSPKMQNSNITGYVILYTTNTSITDREWTPQAVKGDKHSYIIHNLEPSTTYFFKIQARNSKGNGPFSQVVSFQTGATEESGSGGLPGPPQDLKASIVKARFVTLSWQPPVLTNDIISGYSVYYRQEGSERERVQNTSHSHLEDINIGGLQPGQVYYFQVVAHNAHGTGPASKTIRIVTQSEELVPSAPLELNVFSTSASSIHANWKQPENPNGEIQKYNVYYTDTSSSTEWHLETTNLEFDLLSLSAFTEYYIWVNAVNHNGPGTTSEKKLVKTFSAAPSQPPYNVTLEPTSSTSIIVRWEPPPPEGQNGIITGYKLRYRKQGRKGNTLTTPGNLRIFPLNNLERGSVYQVKLLATNVNGTGPPTKWHEVETYDNDLDETKIPEQPSRLKVRPSSEKIYVMWSPPQNQSIKIRNYVIGWGKGVPDNYTEVLDEIQRSFIIHSVEPNSEYVISLYAHNDVGAGEPVYSYVRTRDELPPEPISPLIPPMGLKANVTGSTSVVLYWTDSTLGKTEDVRDNRYYIVKCTDEKSRSRSLNVTQLYAEFFDLKPNTLYEFMVKLVNRKRESPWSLAVQNTTWGLAQYAAPKDLHVVAVEDNPNDVELRWLSPKMQNSYITGYIILYTTNTSITDREWTPQAVKGDKHSYIIHNLEPSTTYFFKIQARNSKGNGPFSQVVSFQTGATEETGSGGLPGPPQDLKASIVKARFVTLSWQPPVLTNDIISGYSVYYRQEGSEREQVQNTSHSHLEDINIGGLQPGQVYYFQVVAHNTHGTGPSSKSLRIVTQSEELVPSAPLELNAFSTSASSIHANWKPPENPNGEIQKYNVYYTNTSSSTEWHLETTNLEFDLLSLSAFTEYYIWVNAVNHNGPGTTSEKKLVKTFSAAPSQPPYNVTLEPTSSTSIIVRWEPPPPEGQNGIITGYKLRYRKLGRKGSTIIIPGNLLIYPLDNLERGSIYQVKLWTTSVNGTGPPTEWYGVETYENDLDETKVPEQPSPLKVHPSSDKIYVMWSPPQNQSTNICNYVIGWGKGMPDNYTEVLDEKQRSFIIRGVEPNTEYVISLRAHNDVGAGEPVYFYVRTREKLPTESVSSLIPPMGLKAHVTGLTSVVLDWIDTTLDKTQDVRGNRYYIVKCSEEKSRNRFLNVTEPHAEFTDLKPNTLYEFMVKLVNMGRESPWSLAVQNTTWAATPNTAPRDLHVVPVEDNPKDAELRWLPPKMQNSYIIGYVILYTTNPSITDREWTPQAVKGDKHIYIIHNLESSTTYFFKIQARNSKGSGPFSHIVSFRTGTITEQV